MTSEAQMLANRANARKSTGPRTAEGKAVVSQNAVTHGFLARETVIPGEDAGEFALYRDWKLRDLAPVGDAELDTAERIVGLSWRLRRAERLQTEAFEALYEKMVTESPAGGTPTEGVPESAPGALGGADRLLGRMLVEDFSNARVLDRLLLYERRIENSLYRTQRELREQKRLRLAGAPAEAVDRVPAQESLRKTNPICEGIGVQGSGISNLTPDPHPLTPEPWRKTKPICTGTRETAAFEAEKGRSEPLRDELGETKPISWGDASAPPAVRRVA